MVRQSARCEAHCWHSFCLRQGQRHGAAVSPPVRGAGTTGKSLESCVPTVVPALVDSGDHPGNPLAARRYRLSRYSSPGAKPFSLEIYK